MHNVSMTNEVAGDNHRSREWTSGSDAIGPSYGPIGIVLSLGFRGGSREGRRNMGGAEAIWGVDDS